MGDAMPMSEQEYSPEPEIPEKVWNSEKQAYTVEEALLAALEVFFLDKISNASKIGQ